jgi:hypothetical protein
MTTSVSRMIEMVKIKVEAQINRFSTNYPYLCPTNIIYNK